MLSRSLLILLALALSGCAVGFNPDAFKNTTPPEHEPLNKEDQRSVYDTCLRAKHIECSTNPGMNTLLIHASTDAPRSGVISSRHNAQKVEAETIGNMWCSLNRVQGSDATILFRYPNGEMHGSACQE
jgi:hypothetical protein